MPKTYDTLVIGGGAAGLCAAIRLKQNDKDLSIAVLEQLPRVAKKLITTGNGRCNITNRDININRYHGESVSFAEYALLKYDNTVIEDFFTTLGVPFFFDEQGRAYPYSLQASSVVDALRFASEELGVEVFTQTTVSDYEKTQNGFSLKTSNGDFFGKTVIAAAGLCSGGKALGSTGGLLSVFKKHGYSTVATTPAIVQIKTEPTVVRSLKGIKVNADATLVVNKKTVRREFGEVLFCDYGLSGPPVLQISRAVERTAGAVSVVLDLMPEFSFGEIVNMLELRSKNLSKRSLEEFFTGLLNKRVGQAIIKMCGLKLSDSVSTLKTADIKALADKIKRMSFAVTGTTGFDNSQVTAGGLNTDNFEENTMMSKREKGMYAVGEILDIDGDCGGFNLQWAWSSAMCAADSIIEWLK